MPCFYNIGPQIFHLSERHASCTRLSVTFGTIALERYSESILSISCSYEYLGELLLGIQTSKNWGYATHFCSTVCHRDFSLYVKASTGRPSVQYCMVMLFLLIQCHLPSLFSTSAPCHVLEINAHYREHKYRLRLVAFQRFSHRFKRTVQER